MTKRNNLAQDNTQKSSAMEIEADAWLNWRAPFSNTKETAIDLDDEDSLSSSSSFSSSFSDEDELLQFDFMGGPTIQRETRPRETHLRETRPRETRPSAAMLLAAPVPCEEKYSDEPESDEEDAGGEYGEEDLGEEEEEEEESDDDDFEDDGFLVDEEEALRAEGIDPATFYSVYAFHFENLARDEEKRRVIGSPRY